EQRRLDHARSRLVVGRLWCADEGDSRHFTSSKTCDVSLSRNRMARDIFGSLSGSCHATHAASLVVSRWRRLHDCRVICEQQASAIFSFHLAFVRSRWHELPLCRCNVVHRLTWKRESSSGPSLFCRDIGQEEATR